MRWRMSSELEIIIIAILSAILIPYSIWLAKQKPKYYRMRTDCDNCQTRLNVKMEYGQKVLGQTINQVCPNCGYRINKKIKDTTYMYKGGI
jgi:DNA-directed RNA polymerase subunit RPC12/RpoP